MATENHVKAVINKRPVGTRSTVHRIVAGSQDMIEFIKRSNTDVREPIFEISTALPENVAECRTENGVILGTLTLYPTGVMRAKSAPLVSWEWQ